MDPVYRFTCNHVGRSADSSGGFIRVAEIRNAQCKAVNVPCPDCKSAGQSPAADLERAFALAKSINGWLWL
jgi:hypothetical protein